jgi:hypothetical protein
MVPIPTAFVSIPLTCPIPTCSRVHVVFKTPCWLTRHISYLSTYDLYGPVRNAFGAGRMADTLLRQVGGGWALEIVTFLSPVKWHRAVRPLPLQLQFRLYIPFLGIAWPQPQFPHSCVCERFIYSQDRSTYFLQQKRPTHRGNI